MIEPSFDPRLGELLERYVEAHALRGDELDVRELCRDCPELLEPLLERIDKYRRVHGLLVPPAPTALPTPVDLEVHSQVGANVDPSPPEPLAPGRILGDRYRIRSYLGAGGMGEVWRAVDLKLRVEVALKAVHRRVIADRRRRELLRREVLAARGVSSLNVCRVYDLVELAGLELVSMECIEGTTLRDLLTARSPLPVSEAQAIAAQLLAGLEAIHSAGLVHGDIKPENVMVSRSGRVVVMDFGLSQTAAEPDEGAAAGTPPYMAPEKRLGGGFDARVDVYAAGVVLAEMVAPGGSRESSSRQRLWEGLRQDPPDLPATPWAPVIRKALAADCEARYSGAAALARALEEVTLRAVGAKGARPYPGLAPFGEDDAGFFFGRELEVEAMWRTLRRPRLLALIGPSGAGKSSFLRAGLLPARPQGWSAVVTTPGSRPFTSLAQALLPELRSDEGAIEDLLRIEEPDVAVALVARWRRSGSHALLVVDQFEELFVLNPTEVQERFASLLQRLVLESDVHVLLAMRDDFLFHCNGFEALQPVFAELTPLGPPTGEALRRIVVQPALLCGYRFEGEAMVEKMISEVAGARGALPLVAFACAQLWERREAERGLLTHRAYEQIGGVSGALAQHAEETLERIGRQRVPIVRELFRNLVTGQGTREARDRDELFSVFPVAERASVEQVLDALIDSRLLVSYEAEVEPSAQVRQSRQGRLTECHVEIVHESLLTSWPHLVRWRAQDEEGAILRDQLRQAARVWTEKGRPEDLLWTGTSYDEYQLWRRRYAGGLTTAEEDFGLAMTALAQSRRLRRRRLVAAVFALLVLGLGIVAAFWHRAADARHRAEQEVLRAEANQLLALGRLQIDTNSTGALAYALASLERVDDPMARLLALEALSKGPSAFVLEGRIGGWGLGFSPDGQWLAAGMGDGSLQLWHRSGGPARILAESRRERRFPYLRFGADSDLLVARAYPSHAVEIWSIPGGDLIRTLKSGDPMDFRLTDEPARLWTFIREGRQTRVETWPLIAGSPDRVGMLGGSLHEASRLLNPWTLDVDSVGSRIAYVPHPSTNPEEGSASAIYLWDLDPGRTAPVRLLGRHPEPPLRLAFDAEGRRLASADEAGEIRLWATAGLSQAPERILRDASGRVMALDFDADGSRLAAANWSGHVSVWDLDGPPDATPMILRPGGIVAATVFHPEGGWLATAGGGAIALWPVTRSHPVDLQGHQRPVEDLAFLPGGKWLASVSQDCTLRLWPLAFTVAPENRVIFDCGSDWLVRMAADPAGERILVGSLSGSIWLVPLDGSEPRALEGFDGRVHALALGERVAAGSAGQDPRNQELRLWDLATGEARTLAKGVDIDELKLTADGHLASGGRLSPEDTGEGVRLWDLADGSFRRLAERAGLVDLGRGGQLLLAGSQGENGEAVLYDLQSGRSLPLGSRGPSLGGRIDDTGRVAVTAPHRGFLEVGWVSGDTVHLLAEQRGISRFEMSPDGRWVALIDGRGTTIRLWPVPDLDQPPLHTLPYELLLAKLRSLTNLRIVEDGESATGWSPEVATFSGWERMPTW